MKSNKFSADVVARLANLSLNKEDLDDLAKQLTVSLDYLRGVQDVSTTNVIPTSQVTGLENVFRADEITPSLSQEEALKNAPFVYNGFFVVDAIFTE